MTPPARLAAAIEVLDSYLSGQPIEKVLTNWARRSRFAGSKDRAAIRDIVFACLRRRKSYAARSGAETGRGFVIAYAADHSMPELETLFSGEGHAPAPLSDAESSQLQSPTENSSWEAMHDLPDWLRAEAEQSLGSNLDSVAQALKDRAPVFARVNLARATREEAAVMLHEEGVKTRPRKDISSALEVFENERRLSLGKAYAKGIVEMQDATSQAICLGLPPADRMLDYCAGGGGKVLAYAALNSGKMFAHDANTNRLRDLPARAARAGAQIDILDQAACRTQAPFDLVLCDVPCSGSGAWRRSPEGKWSLTPAMFETLLEAQAAILDEAADLVGPGGCLAYVTCSVFVSENTAQIQKFIDGRSGWSVAFEHQYLPGKDGDGLFVAHLTRKAATD